MELILVRHALPIRREGVVGPADPELSEAGHEQAQHLARYLSQETLHAIYASPMKRAQQTAEPLSSLTGLPIVTVDDVAEYDRTSNEYIPIEELKASNDPRYQETISGEWSSDESYEDFSARVNSGIENLIDAHSGQTIVVVCHGGVINEYLSRVLGLTTGRFFYPNYTSIHRVAASRQGHRGILSVNESGHLRGTGLPIGIFHG